MGIEDNLSTCSRFLLNLFTVGAEKFSGSEFLFYRFWEFVTSSRFNFKVWVSVPHSHTQLPRAQKGIAFLCLAREEKFFNSLRDAFRRPKEAVRVWGWGVCACIAFSRKLGNTLPGILWWPNINELFNYSSHTPKILANCCGRQQASNKKLLFKKNTLNFQIKP